MALDDCRLLRGDDLQAGWASDDGPWRSKLAEEGIPFHRLLCLDPFRYPRSVRYGLGIPLTTARLLQLVKRHRYDCLYVHHWQSTLPAAVCRRLTGIPYVFLAHLEPQAGGAGLLRPGGNVVAVSEAVKRAYVARFNLRSDTVRVLPNAVGIDVRQSPCPATLYRGWNIDPFTPVVGCVALLNAQKGHAVLLQAWQRVGRIHPGAVLALAGDGPLRPDLERQAERLGIDGNVRFLGMLDRPEELYARASMLVLPSLAEGMPLVPLEAAAFGLPTIATVVGGTPEVITDGETGLLVPAGDVAALSDAILCLLENPNRRHALGEAARNRVRTKHSPAARIALLRQVFNLAAGHEERGFADR